MKTDDMFRIKLAIERMGPAGQYAESVQELSGAEFAALTVENLVKRYVHPATAVVVAKMNEGR